MVIYIMAVVLTAVGVILFFVARRKSRLKQSMEMTATTTVRNLRDGEQVELKGRALCASPLNAPFTDQPCLYYEYTIEQRQQRRDSDGSSHSEWRTIDRGKNYATFELDDGTGVVAIEGDGAKFDARQICKRPIDSGCGVDFKAFGMNFNLGSRPQRITVKAVVAGGNLYVLGTAQRQSDGSFRIVKADGHLFISDRSEEAIRRSLGRQSMGLYIGAAVGVAAGVALAICQALGVLGGKV